jgi:hypothetical protein
VSAYILLGGKRIYHLPGVSGLLSRKYFPSHGPEGKVVSEADILNSTVPGYWLAQAQQWVLEEHLDFVVTEIKSSMRNAGVPDSKLNALDEFFDQTLCPMAKRETRFTTLCSLLGGDPEENRLR